MVSHTRSKAMLFCEGSSIRGMQKIIKAKTRFLRILWILFVFIMTTVLIVTSVFLILDYLNFDKAWHTSQQIDERPPFPSITVCSHNPFSTRANEIWRKKQIMSPTQFSTRLINMSLEGLWKNNFELSSISLFDKIETYYMSLTENETSQLGHDRSMMRYCMIVKDGFNTVSENCTNPQKLNMQLTPFTSSNHFNCWTLEGTDHESSRSIDSAIILIAITPASDIPELKHNFVMDMLDRGEGLKLTIHPRGHYPDIMRNGLNVEPGKMNEFIYDTTEWRRLSTPKVPCFDNQADMFDLNRHYKYAFPQCLQSVLQKRLIDDCGCQNAMWPRLKSTAVVPYCMLLTKNISVWLERFKCANELVELQRNISRAAENTQCFPRCIFHTYKLSPSITKWQPSAMKLETLTRRYRSFESFTVLSQKYNLHTGEQVLSHEAAKPLKLAYRDALLSNFSSDNSSVYRELFSGDRFSFVKLSRRNFDITVKVEKLVFDLNILASRIGGLCSLCIGLTAAFVIELVEFLYLYFRLPSNNGTPTAGQTPTSGAGPESLATHSTSQFFPTSGNNERFKAIDLQQHNESNAAPDKVTHRHRPFTYNHEEEPGDDMLRLTAYEGRYGLTNHYADSPWYRMNNEAPCTTCGRGFHTASPISSV